MELVVAVVEWVVEVTCLAVNKERGKAYSFLLFFFFSIFLFALVQHSSTLIQPLPVPFISKKTTRFVIILFPLFPVISFS